MLKSVFLLTLLISMNPLEVHALAKAKYRKENPNCYKGVPSEFTWGKTQALFAGASIPTAAEIRGGWRYLGWTRIGKTYTRGETQFFCSTGGYNPNGITNSDGSLMYFLEFFSTIEGNPSGIESAKVNVLNALQWTYSQSSIPIVFVANGACFPVYAYGDSAGMNGNMYQCKVLKDTSGQGAERLICAMSRMRSTEAMWNYQQEICTFPEDKFETEVYFIYGR